MVVMNDAEGGRSILQSNILLKLKSLLPHIRYMYATKKAILAKTGQNFLFSMPKSTLNMSYAHTHIKSTPTYTFIITAYSRPCLRFHSCGSKMFSKTNPSPAGRTSLVPSISVSANFSDMSDFVNFDTVCIFH